MRLSVAIVRYGVTGSLRHPRGRPSSMTAKKMYRGFRHVYCATSPGWALKYASMAGRPSRGPIFLSFTSSARTLAYGWPLLAV